MNNVPDVAHSAWGQSSASLAANDSRATIRWRLHLPVLIKNSRGMKLFGIMKNLSESGCLLSFEGHPPLEAGRFYCIKVDGIEMLGAYAVWIDRAAAGFLFSARLHPAIVEHTARYSDKPALDEMNTSEPHQAFHAPVAGRLEFPAILSAV